MNAMRDETSARRVWPMVPPAPIAVVVLGIVVAVVVGAIGIHQLHRQASASAAARAQLLATTVAARIGAIPEGARHDLLERASRRSGSALWLVDGKGKVVDELSSTEFPIELPERLARAEVETSRGRVAFDVAEVPSASPLSVQAKEPKHEDFAVVVAIEVPDSPEGEREMVSALVTLTALLLGIAAAVAYAVARDVRLDVDDLAGRIREIAARGRESTDRAQDAVSVQSLDEVGELACAFNGLVERFAKAEKTYADALARMEEIDRERSAFLATVSHELRSPLNAILGFADVLLSEVDGPLHGEAREEVAVIKQSGLHLLALINDILELSAIASGQLRLARAPADLVPLAEEVVREAFGARGNKPLGLRIEKAQHAIVADVDARRVRQILGNLVGNAVKFTPRGEVVVSLDADAHYATIRVRDTGPGIPREERDAIFAEYVQSGDKRSRRRGSGLGLAIARRLAMMHGGTIRLESEVGVGSTFVLRLPVRAPASIRPIARSADDTGAYGEIGA